MEVFRTFSIFNYFIFCFIIFIIGTLTSLCMSRHVLNDWILSFISFSRTSLLMCWKAPIVYMLILNTTKLSKVFIRHRKLQVESLESFKSRILSCLKKSLNLLLPSIFAFIYISLALSLYLKQENSALALDNLNGRHNLK